MAGHCANVHEPGIQIANMELNRNFTFTSSMGETVVIEPYNVKKAIAVLKALNHPLRQDLLNLLDPVTGTTVSEVFKSLHKDQSAVSLHVGILRKAGIVIPNYAGRHIFYKVNADRLLEVDACITALNDYTDI